MQQQQYTTRSENALDGDSPCAFFFNEIQQQFHIVLSYQPDISNANWQFVGVFPTISDLSNFEKKYAEYLNCGNLTHRDVCELMCIWGDEELKA